MKTVDIVRNICIGKTKDSNHHLAFLDDNNKPILTEGHTGRLIDNNDKEYLVKNIREASLVLTDTLDHLEDLRIFAGQDYVNQDDLGKLIEEIKDSIAIAVAMMLRIPNKETICNNEA